jgi:protein SCO1/2
MYSAKVDTKDMDLAITETWGNKISFSKTLDFVTLACYSYNYKDGKYSINFPVVIGAVSLLVGLLLTLGALYNAKRRIS